MLRNHSVGFADTSRRLRLHFSTDFVRHFPRLHSAALLKCFSPSRRLCRLFSQVSPALLDGLRPSLPAVSLRRTSQMLCALPSASPTLLDGFTVTSRRLYLLFPLALPALLDGLSPSLLAGFTGTSQMLCAFSRFSNRTSRRTWSATSRRT